MRLILSTLFLAFAAFFTAVEASFQSSEGSTSRNSGRRSGQGRISRPSESVRSDHSDHSVESRSSRLPAIRTHSVQQWPLQEQQETSRRSTKTRQPLQSDLEHSRDAHIEHSSTSTSSSSSLRINQMHYRSRSPARRYPDTPRPRQFYPGETSQAYYQQGQASNLPIPRQLYQGENSQAYYQQEEAANSAHQSSSPSHSTGSTSTSSYSTLSTPSRPYSPTGPYSFEYNSPSERSESGSRNGSP